MSVAMAAHLAPSPRCCSLVLKNTFLEFVHRSDTATSRRCRSASPARIADPLRPVLGHLASRPDRVGLAIPWGGTTAWAGNGDGACAGDASVTSCSSCTDPGARERWAGVSLHGYAETRSSRRCGRRINQPLMAVRRDQGEPRKRHPRRPPLALCGLRACAQCRDCGWYGTPRRKSSPGFRVCHLRRAKISGARVGGQARLGRGSGRSEEGSVEGPQREHGQGDGKGFCWRSTITP
mmetsp:Transcript_79720/g.185101  ORF Transcript_79720/g.185101 Transcript_79720/m.185101 type:complete len:236 (+) Transcript_79720:20-727(+)